MRAMPPENSGSRKIRRSTRGFSAVSERQMKSAMPSTARPRKTWTIVLANQS